MDTLIARQAFPSHNLSLSPSASGQPSSSQSRTPLVFPFVPPVAWATSQPPSTPRPQPNSSSPPTHEQTFAIRSLSSVSIPGVLGGRKGSDFRQEDREVRANFAEDPFFSRYGQSQPVDESTQQPRKKRPIRAQDIRIVPHHPSNGTPGEDSQPTEGIKSPRTVRVNVLILGAAKVGKTTFIKRAPALNSTAKEGVDKHFLVDGTSYHANLIEGPSDAIESSFLDRDHLSKIDGAVLLFDAMDEKTLDCIPAILKAFKSARKSILLVSSKTDCHAMEAISRLADIEEKARGYAGGADIPQVSIFSLESYQCIMSTLIRDMTVNKKGDPDTRPVSIVSTRRRAQSTAQSTTTVSRGHQRSNSDGSERSALRPSASHHTLPKLHERSHGLHATDPLKRDGARSPTRPRPKLPLKSSLLALAEPSTRSPTSFLDLRESVDIDRTVSNDQPSLNGDYDLDAAAEDQLTERAPATLKQLVERLLSSTTGAVKERFSTNFLTFYRFFATPSEFMSLTFKYYRKTAKPASKTRVLDLLHEWIQAFPGDFARLATRQKLANFLSRVDSSDPRLNAVARQILKCLESSVSEDDDTDWACSDCGHLFATKQQEQPRKRGHAPTTPPQDPAFASETFGHRRLSSAQTFFDFSRGSLDEAPVSPTTIKTSQKHAEFDEKLMLPSDRTLTLNAMGPTSYATPLPHSASSTQSLALMSESAQRHAALLGSKTPTPLSKNTWRVFMAQSDEAIARELTRIDWILFSAIRPRDFIRHATVAQDDRHMYPALAHVTRAVDHFNHLACWVAGLILLRDKAKHRAEMLEKLMRVARRLRIMNNYNALGAFVAALHSCAISRLVQTRDLVREETRRDFQKLEILMSTQRGGSAYRCAWENTRSERIPFLFSHRRDLVIAECGNKTFVDASTRPPSSGSPPAASSSQPIPIPSRSTPPSPPTEPAAEPLINFPKFTLMGESLAQITAAQAMPYQGLVANEDIRALLLDVLVEKDDDALYQRSVAVEPGNGVVGSDGAIKASFKRWAGKG